MQQKGCFECMKKRMKKKTRKIGSLEMHCVQKNLCLLIQNLSSQKISSSVVRKFDKSN
jgi:hypothetical protein